MTCTERRAAVTKLNRSKKHVKTSITLSVSSLFSALDMVHSFFVMRIIVSILEPCFNEHKAMQAITHLQSPFELVYGIPAWIKA